MAIQRKALCEGGLEVTSVIPGMMRLNEWDLTPEDLLGWLQACVDMGITTFDHADIYGSYTNEARFGDALALEPALRDDIQLITKCGIMLLSDNRPDTQVKHYDTTKGHIIASVDRSLSNLRTDYIDLLLIHRPDPLMNVDELAAAFDELKQAGKALHFGVSNFTPSQFELLQSRLDFPLQTNQIEFSVLHMQPLLNGQFDQCQQQRITPMIWSPLAGGRIFNPHNERQTRLQHTMLEIADELGGASLDQLALAWVMKHPTQPIPILGTGKIERIQSAIGATELQMTRQQWFRIWEASAGHEVP